MWKEGSIRVNGEVFHYWMKQYDKGSEGASTVGAFPS